MFSHALGYYKYNTHKYSGSFAIFIHTYTHLYRATHSIEFSKKVKGGLSRAFAFCFSSYSCLTHLHSLWLHYSDFVSVGFSNDYC